MRSLHAAVEEQQPPVEGQGAEEQTASGNQTAPEMGDERPVSWGWQMLRVCGGGRSWWLVVLGKFF